MSEIPRTGELATDDRRLLAYVQHMAQTAQPAAAKRLFGLFAQQRNRRIEVNGCSMLLVSGHNGIGGAKMPLILVGEGGHVRLMPSGLRIARPEAMWQKTYTTRGETMKKSAGSRGKRVSFQVTAEPGSEVFVAGSFNNWNPTQYRMSDNPGSGHCTTTLVLPLGRHEYKFVVNGEWRVDPNCAELVPNGCGSLNSIILSV